MTKRHCWSLVALCLVAVFCFRSFWQPISNSRTKLVVLVVFDQLRADYLTRWSDQFGDGGFRRLSREGTTYFNCNYPYANTVTGAGHATIATGCTPDQHGIIDNDWYDRAAAKAVNCATSSRVTDVCSVSPPSRTAPDSDPSSGSPDKLLVPTFADALKSATNNRAKVVALSHKDRAACLVGGKHADACYWYDDRTGTFATSTYYRDRVHDWVAKFNAQRTATKWQAQVWNRFRPDLDYVKLAGPDDVAAERPGVHRAQGRVFPHTFSQPEGVLGRKYFEELMGTPFGNELLFDLAKTAISAMQLGRGDATDFLSISFSCNDVVGHAFGPDSQEVLDMTLRSDDLVSRLLTYLDAEVGKGNYVLALCSDHGVCPLPEVAIDIHREAMRVKPGAIRDLAEQFLNHRYGAGSEKARWIEDFPFPWLYLNYRLISSKNLKTDEVAAALAEHLRQQAWAAGVFTRAELDRTPTSDSTLIGQMRRCYHPERAGDIGLILKPYCLCIDKSEGTTHGSPYEYDTHVPLVIYGRGVPGGFSEDSVSPQCIAWLLAKSAGVAMELPPEASPPAPFVLERLAD